LDGSRQIGSLAPNSVFARRAAVDLSDEWPLPVRVFIIWLTAILWAFVASARIVRQRSNAVSDRTKFDGLTQFERRRASCRSQTADSKHDRRRQFDAAGVCNNQVPDGSQTVDPKDGEMAEWLKAHAWK